MTSVCLQLESDKEKLLKIRDSYKKNWPQYCYVYSTLETTITWKFLHKCNIKFFISEHVEEDGAFVIITQNLGLNAIFFFAFKEAKVDFRAALLDGKIVNWNSIQEAPNCYCPELEALHESFIVKEIRPKFNRVSPLWWLSKENANNFEIQVPAGFYIDFLTTKHAEEILKFEENSYRNLQYIEELIRFNFGVGLFRHEDNALVTWVVQNEYGLMGLLRTHEQHRRRGYANIIVKKMCQILAERNLDSLACTFIQNIKSEALFTSLGFKVLNYKHLYVW